MKATQIACTLLATQEENLVIVGVISWNSAGLRGLTHRKERSQPVDLFLEIRYKYRKFSLGF